MALSKCTLAMPHFEIKIATPPQDSTRRRNRRPESTQCNTQVKVLVQLQLLRTFLQLEKSGVVDAP